MNTRSAGVKNEKESLDIDRLVAEAQSTHKGSPSEIPPPLLKIALERFGKGNKEKQMNILQAIWVLLFGDGEDKFQINLSEKSENKKMYLL